MSVNYYVCKNCGNTFCDCGDYVSCECGESWCSDSCAEEDGFVRKDYECDCEDDCNCEEEYEETSSCGYCRCEKFDEFQIIQYLLAKYNISEDDIIQEMIANGRGKNE